MKKIEKLKLNEMQDFTVIEKKESTALKGGWGWAATANTWQTFVDRANRIDPFDIYYSPICGSGTKYLKDGKEFWTGYRVAYWERSNYHEGQFSLGSVEGSNGSWSSLYIDAPTNGTNYEYYNGWYFGWENGSNVNYF